MVDQDLITTWTCAILGQLLFSLIERRKCKKKEMEQEKEEMSTWIRGQKQKIDKAVIKCVTTRR